MNNKFYKTRLRQEITLSKLPTILIVTRDIQSSNVERVNTAFDVNRQKYQFYKSSGHTYARRQLLRRRPRDPHVGNP